MEDHVIKNMDIFSLEIHYWWGTPFCYTLSSHTKKYHIQGVKNHATIEMNIMAEP